MLSWILYMTAMGTLVLVFGLSVSHKLRDYPRFKASLAAYQLVPERLLDLLAVREVGHGCRLEVSVQCPEGTGRSLVLQDDGGSVVEALAVVDDRTDASGERRIHGGSRRIEQVDPGMDRSALARITVPSLEDLGEVEGARLQVAPDPERGAAVLHLAEDAT